VGKSTFAATSDKQHPVVIRAVEPWLKFQDPAPDIKIFGSSSSSNIQKCFPEWLCSLKTIVLFVQLACPADYARGNGTQISSSGSTICKFLAPAIQNYLGSGSTAMVVIDPPEKLCSYVSQKHHRKNSHVIMHSLGCSVRSIWEFRWHSL